MTVEASVVVPIIIFLVITVILIFMHLYEREYLRSEIYEKTYTIPYHNTKNDSTILSYLESFNSENVYMFGTKDAKAECAGGQITFHGSINIKIRDDFDIKHEVGKCTDRLRRWQLYEVIAEE